MRRLKRLLPVLIVGSIALGALPAAPTPARADDDILWGIGGFLLGRAYEKGRHRKHYRRYDYPRYRDRYYDYGPRYRRSYYREERYYDYDYRPRHRYRHYDPCY